jgi:hypothetical protein
MISILIGFMVIVFSCRKSPEKIERDFFEQCDCV